MSSIDTARAVREHVLRMTSGGRSSHVGSALSCASGGDYVGVSGTLTFALGETTKIIRVDLHDCADVESCESFTLTLSSPTGATIGRANGTYVVLDDD